MDIVTLLLTMADMFKKNTQRIFLDYAAATPMSERALAAYTDATKFFANPQALHTEGLQAARVRDDAKSTIAKILGIKSHELVFTSGGTEANNLGIAGYLLGLEEKGIAMSDCHVITSSIEHPSVTNVFAPFIARGLTLTKVDPNEHGEIKPETVEEALQSNTVLVSLALVNSEIGTVQPLHAIGKILKEREPQVGDVSLEKIVFHTDACQGMYQSLVPQGLNVDLLSLNAGKMYGPRGVGALYIRHGVRVAPVLRGGSQEDGLRPGTENVALAAGFAAAFSEVAERRTQESQRITELRESLITELKKVLPDIIVNGDAKTQTPHILNISIPGIDAEYVAMYLDQRGLAFSTRSACLARADAARSHVVAALGGEDLRATSALRFSFGRDTHTRDISVIVEKLHEAVKTYRAFS